MIRIAFLILVFMSSALAGVGQAQQPRLASLSQQKMCATEARQAFNESYSHHGKDGLMYDYTSHYDAKANVCYILVHGFGVFKDSGASAASDIVFDAFEGRTYASYIWINSQGKKYWEVAPMDCSVKPRGQEEVTCKSSDEFDTLIDKHFGVGR